MTTIPSVRLKPTGEPVLYPTQEAKRVAMDNSRRSFSQALPQDAVHAQAERVLRQEGVVNPSLVDIRAQYELQFGKYRGRTFLWLAENDLGYAGYLIASMKKEGGSTPDTSLGNNKAQLKVTFRVKLILIFKKLYCCI